MDVAQNLRNLDFIYNIIKKAERYISYSEIVDQVMLSSDAVPVDTSALLRKLISDLRIIQFGDGDNPTFAINAANSDSISYVKQFEEEHEHKELKKTKMKQDIEIGTRVLKDYGRTKRFSIIAFYLSLGLALWEITRSIWITK